MATKKTTATTETTEPKPLSEICKETVAYKTSDHAQKASAVVIVVHGYKFAPKSRNGSGREWCSTTGFHKSVYKLAAEIAKELGAEDDDGDDDSDDE